jgi:hypothetical protein
MATIEYIEIRRLWFPGRCPGLSPPCPFMARVEHIGARRFRSQGVFLAPRSQQFLPAPKGQVRKAQGNALGLGEPVNANPLLKLILWRPDAVTNHVRTTAQATMPPEGGRLRSGRPLFLMDPQNPAPKCRPNHRGSQRFQAFLRPLRAIAPLESGCRVLRIGSCGDFQRWPMQKGGRVESSKTHHLNLRTLKSNAGRRRQEHPLERPATGMKSVVDQESCGFDDGPISNPGRVDSCSRFSQRPLH